MSPRSLPLLLLPCLALAAALPALAELGGALDRPDLLAYSSFPPRSDGLFISTTTYAGGVFQGNLSDVHTTTDTTGTRAVPLYVGGYAGGFTVGGAGAQLLFLLDEPDSISRNAKKITVQQKAWLNVEVQGFDGAADFSAGPIDHQACSAKATVKDKGGDGTADEGSVKVKCKSVEALIAELGLTGAAADTVRAIFGTGKAKLGIKDTDGPSNPTP